MQARNRIQIVANMILGFGLIVVSGCGHDITRTGSGTGGGGAGAGVDSAQTNSPIGGDVGTNATGTPSAAGASSTNTGPDKPSKDGSHEAR